MEDRLIDALKRVTGAYSLVVLSEEALIGVRDPMGVRPLVLGKLPSEDGKEPSWVLASENLWSGHYRRRICARCGTGRTGCD